MQKAQIQKPQKLKVLKQWIFQYVYIVESNIIKNKYADILRSILQITIPLYFYLHRNLIILDKFVIYQDYMKIVNIYLVNINRFDSIGLCLTSLVIYPIALILGLIIKKYNQNKILIAIFQIIISFYQLWFLKIIIQTINGFSYPEFSLLVLVLSLISLLFGLIILFLQDNIHRYIQIILVIMLQTKANLYLIISCLAIRLIILSYLFYPKNKNILRLLVEIAFFITLLSSHYVENNILDYLGLICIIICHFVYGLRQLYKYYEEQNDLIALVELLEQESELQQGYKQNILNKIFVILQKHEIDCQYINCLCHEYQNIQLQSLKQWIFKFQEEVIRKKVQLKDRINYAMICADKYDFKLTGLLRVCSEKSDNYLQQYQIYKICLIYELNLRKNGKNYKYGEKHYDVQEEIQHLKNNIQDIIEMLRYFWSLILDFDGSLKFLDSIISISTAIKQVIEKYNSLIFKYDDDSLQFQYLFGIFQTIVLNEKILEQDQLVVPNLSIFFITNENTIVNANNNFAALVKQPIKYIIGKNYTSYIPEVYRDVHKEWTASFYQKINQYQHKQFQKCLNLGNMQITMVNMSHKILPRFSEGIQIFSNIEVSNQCDKSKKSFIFLVQKQTFFIKNIEDTFFEIVRFKVNKKNFKLLSQSSLTSIFKNFTLVINQNPNRQVTIYQHFTNQFTYVKQKILENHKKTKKYSQINKSDNIQEQVQKSNFSSNKHNKKKKQQESVYQFEVIPNTKPEDPYLKILFKLKQQKNQLQQVSSQTAPSIINRQQQQPKNPLNNYNKISFRIPYYIVFIYLALHIIFKVYINTFQTTLENMVNRQQFIVHYDFTFLYTENNTFGRNQLIKLKDKWIKGYGAFSQSFNNIRSIEDPYFKALFKNQATQQHNIIEQNIHLFYQINKDKLKEIEKYVLILVIFGIIHYCIDLIFSLRYIFRTQQRIGYVLTQFVVIQAVDILNITKVINNFSINIINYQQGIKKTFRIPKQDIYQQSALELNKNDRLSLNNSGQMPSQSEAIHLITNENSNFRYKKKRVSRNFNRQRVSLSLMKKQFGSKMTDQMGYIVHAQDSQDTRLQLITEFKSKYNKISFIFTANKLLMSVVFISFLLAIIMFGVFLLTIYKPIIYLPNHIKIWKNLHESQIILVKTIIQIQTSSKLNPQLTLSKNLLQSIQFLQQLPQSKRLDAFNKQFRLFRQENVCSRIKASFNCSQISNISEINQYGIRIINQYLQQYFRTATQKSIKINNNYYIAIKYDFELYDYLSKLFYALIIDHMRELQTSQLRLTIVGSLISLFGCFALHIVLKMFNTKAQNTINLLKIIPEDVKIKNVEMVDKIIKKNQLSE